MFLSLYIYVMFWVWDFFARKYDTRQELARAYKRKLNLEEINENLRSMYMSALKEVNSVKKVNQELAQKNKFLKDENERLSEEIKKLENRKFIP